MILEQLLSFAKHVIGLVLLLTSLKERSMAFVILILGPYVFRIFKEVKYALNIFGKALYTVGFCIFKSKEEPNIVLKSQIFPPQISHQDGGE